MIGHYLKVTFRNLMKHKVHSLISVVCLAVGIVVFSVVYYLFVVRQADKYELSANEVKVELRSFHSEAETDWNYEDIKTDDFIDMQNHCKGVLDTLVAVSFSREAEIEVIDNKGMHIPYNIKYEIVGGAYYSTPGMRLLYGDRVPERPDEIVISSRFADRISHLGTPVGKVIRLLFEETGNGLTDYKIVNVIDESRAYAGDEVHCYFPLEMNKKLSLQVSARISTDKTPDEINSRLSRIKWGKNDSELHVKIRPYEDRKTPVLLMILFLSSLVFVSAAISFLRYTFQTFYMRQHEMALRKCMGVDNRGLFMLLFCEVACMFTVAYYVSLLITELSYPLLDSCFPVGNWLDKSSCYTIQSWLYLVVLLVSVVLVYFPVRRMSGDKLITFVGTHRRNRTFRTVMLGLQIAISLFFLSAVLVMHLSYKEIYGNKYSPLNEEEEQRVLVVTAQTPRMAQHWLEIRSRIKTLPEIEEQVGMQELSFAHATVMGYVRADSSTVMLKVASGEPQYFDFFHIPLEGEIADSNMSGVIYIDKSLADMLKQDGNNDGMIKLNNTLFRIAGVYENLYNAVSVKGKYDASVFIPSSQPGTLLLKIDSQADLDVVKAKVEQIVRTYVPETLSVTIEKIGSLKQVDYIVPYMLATVLYVISAICLLLVVLSVYTSVSLDTKTRQKEVAIRKINGATPWNIAFLFVRSYLWLYLVVFLFVYPCSRLLLIRILEGSGANTPYEWGWGVILFVSFGVLLIVTLMWKIRLVMQLNPADVLKKD